VLLETDRLNHHIVDVNLHQHSEKIMEDQVHSALEHCTSILQAKGHNNQLE
jgi:hypothetical protein